MKKVTRNVPEALLRAQISELSLREVATSMEFNRIIENSIAAVLTSHNRNRYMRFNIDYMPNSDMTACTDNTNCYVNAASEMFTEDADSDEAIPVKESCQRIYGASFHEIGHVLYTCFSEMKRMGQLFENGDLCQSLIGTVSQQYFQ